MDIRIEKTTLALLDTAYTLTRELMIYHDALDIFTMTKERMGELIESKILYSYIAYSDDMPVGIMNFFFKLTTFTGRKILYIEDLYARKEARGLGVGSSLLELAKKTASENDCEQIELKCAVWNEKSAEFYNAKGFESDSDWNTFIMDRNKF